MKGEHPYDALLDDYEPGITVEFLDELFSDVGQFLKGLIGKITGTKQSSIDKVNAHFSALKGKQLFSVPAQKELCEKIVSDLGFDFTRGRVDTAAHPFCTGISVDTRLTTRYDLDNPLMSLFGLVHEAGHGMYVQGLPSAYMGTVVGQARSCGVHESQSLIWENYIARSRSFWAHYWPLLEQTFPKFTKGISAEELYCHMNRVEPSLIRVDADEVTYVLHIIIRYEIEKALLEESMSVDDLPSAWQQKYQEYLGITPENDAEGVLQDVHWGYGAFGYFPSYALGNFFAAQIYDVLHDKLQAFDKKVTAGDFSQIKSWLNHHIHAEASHLETTELVEKSTAKPLSADAFKSYLTRKTADVYRLNA